jgi:hypothetical protein
MRVTLLLCLLCCICTGRAFACGAIPYSVVEGYFVRNDVQMPVNPKIETAEDFDRLFGAATTMSRKPTQIDFSRQFVVAIILPETAYSTEITPLNIRKTWRRRLTVQYKVTVGAAQTYTVRPLLLLVIDRINKGKVQLMAIEN